jgi:hypothetical protein
MTLDVYYKQDILNVLRATYVASEGPASLVLETLADPDLPVEHEVLAEKMLHVYRQGFCTALAAVGLAFGLAPVEHNSEERRGDRAPAPPAFTGHQENAIPNGLDRIGFLWAEAKDAGR